MYLILSDEEIETLQYLAARRGEGLRAALRRTLRHAKQSAEAADTVYSRAGMSAEEAAKFRKAR